MEKQLTELKFRLQEINSLNAASALMSWDQSTYMPAQSAPYRGQQMADLGRMAHERLIAPEIGHLLDALQPKMANMNPLSTEAAMVAITRHDYDRAKRIPADFVAEFAQHSSHAYVTWKKARAEKNFRLVSDVLKKTLELSQRLAAYYPEYSHPIDALIADVDPGFNVATLRPLFQELRSHLVPLFREVTAAGFLDNSCLNGHFSETAQWQFGEKVVAAMGYDFQRGRQDKTAHPFMTRFSAGDVRITTRVNEYNIVDSLFSTIHEAGHALYELGIDPSLEGTRLASGTSSAVHESQSRLWENLVGRSFDFWQHFFPVLQATFPEQLGQVNLSQFYKAINRVEGSLIRTDADEVTYNLHVMIRFDLECALLEGRLKVSDLPEAWDSRYETDIGIRAPHVGDGVLQDVHWFAGTIGGYFQSYTIGNIMSAQFFQKAAQVIPELSAQIQRGEFVHLREWLRKEIHQYGRKIAGPELVQRATGRALEIAPYVNYLQSKYRAILKM